MKKYFLTLAIAACALCTNAQTREYYGTKEGGFALSFNANPVLNYLGNMFNGTQNNSLQDFEGLSNELFNGVTITGKYMLSNELAVDLGFGFDNNSQTSYAYESDYGSGYEKDRGDITSTSNKYMFKAGIEYRLLPGDRLQPIFGADLVYMHANNSQESNLKGQDDRYAGHPINAIGLLGNVGVEYFIFKNISLAAFLNLGLSYKWNGESYEDGSEDGSRTESSTLKLKTGSLGGNLALNFYF